MTREERQPTQEEIDAAVERDKAEAEKHRQEARIHRYVADMTEIDLAKKKDEDELKRVGDHFQRIHRFVGEVRAQPCQACIDRLNQWHHLDPECDITIVINSPGGSVFEGMALYDHIRYISEQGHHIKTVAQGMAASMGGVLLQAGDERVMNPGSMLLIHEASFMAAGSFGDVEDQVKMVKMLQKRIKQIYLDRAGDKITESAFTRGWNRTDWWLTPEMALDKGFIDKIE